jgi:hypothetical protein
VAKNSRKIKKPFWQTQPCPAWCWSNHSKSDGDLDRYHASRWSKSVKLTTMDPVRHDFKDLKVYFTPVKAVVYLNQGYRETQPRVVVEDGNGRFELDLTLAEAQRLAKALNHAIELAGGDR